MHNTDNESTERQRQCEILVFFRRFYTDFRVDTVRAHFSAHLFAYEILALAPYLALKATF